MSLLIFRVPLGEEPSTVWRVFERAIIGLGSPNVIFGVLIAAAVWLFHRDAPTEVFAIFATFIVIATFRPLEAVAKYGLWFLDRPKPINRADLIGSVAAHQSPGIVLVRQAEARTIAQGTPMVIADQHGPPQLGVALNYVGRDEGNLLRVLTTSLPARLAALHGGSGQATSGMAYAIAVTDDDKADIRALQWIDRLCGIVDSETSPEYLQFEVIKDAGLAEGSLAEVRIGDNQRVIYQVVDGVTRDEVVQQKNKYGYARAKARKIGNWDEDSSRFCRHIGHSRCPQRVGNHLGLSAEKQTFESCLNVAFPAYRQCLFLALSRLRWLDGYRSQPTHHYRDPDAVRNLGRHGEPARPPRHVLLYSWHMHLETATRGLEAGCCGRSPRWIPDGSDSRRSFGRYDTLRRSNRQAGRRRPELLRARRRLTASRWYVERSPVLDSGTTLR